VVYSSLSPTISATNTAPYVARKIGSILVQNATLQRIAYNAGLPQSLLTAARISKRFGSNAALAGASFSVRDNEVLGLIGPNGSGKTTLFECLAGLIPADAGDVEFRGVTLAPAQRKKSIFYLPDAIRPWPDERVHSVLEFLAAMFGRAPGDLEVLSRNLDVARFAQARIGSLSKGELKRVLIAIGLLAPHPLLLLDEPFDGLDFRQTREVTAVLRAGVSQRTLFLSIHQLNDAARVCDRMVLLSRGQVAGEGTLDELRAASQLSAGGLEEIFLALT
jgi:ABC-2 type transport system ATP-binding protein